MEACLFKAKNDIKNSKVNKGFDEILESIKQTEFKINLTDGTIEPSIKASSHDASVSFNLSNNTLETSSYVNVTQDTKLGTVKTISPSSSSIGLSVKNKNNVEKSSGYGVDTKGPAMDREFFSYYQEKQPFCGLVPACVTKETSRRNIAIPLLGKLGTIRNEVTVCPDSITYRTRTGINTEGGLTAASVVPAVRATNGATKAVKALKIGSRIQKLIELDTLGEMIPQG